MWLQSSGQIAKAATMRFFVAVDDAKSVFAARGEEEVVSSHCVFDNTKHHVAAVGVEWITRGQVDAARIVECPA